LATSFAKACSVAKASALKSAAQDGGQEGYGAVSSKFRTVKQWD
jgi:hypothetical protein